MDEIGDVGLWGAHMSLEVGRHFQMQSAYQSQWTYRNPGLTNNSAFIISWTFSAEVAMFCPQYFWCP
jgi:hypothetical protein